MKTLFFLICCFFISMTSFAQYFEYYDGYVITESNDTIRGQLQDLGIISNCNKIRMRDINGEKIKIKKRDIKSFKMGDKIFVKRKIAGSFGSKGYMQLLEEGKINLYAYREEDPSTLVKEAIETRYTEELYLEKDGKTDKVTRLFFKSLLKKYLSDSPNLFKKVSEGDLKYKDLASIISEYNSSKN